MKLQVAVTGLESVFRGLRQRSRSAAQAASAAATDALAQELERSKNGDVHSIGVEDASVIERELGTLNNEPTPWLAPVLPAVRGPMRAAAVSAAARAISSSKRKA